MSAETAEGLLRGGGARTCKHAYAMCLIAIKACTHVRPEKKVRVDSGNDGQELRK